MGHRVSVILIWFLIHLMKMNQSACASMLAFQRLYLCESCEPMQFSLASCIKVDDYVDNLSIRKVVRNQLASMISHKTARPLQA